ncbi:hypothetical protein DTQ70_08870 [Runella sp. SP2]|nr:hypothetical protein DTQ70_08870 [Runella sp. SP2]
MGRKLNLIVVIDQRVIIGGLTNIQLRSGSDTFSVNYEPGNLTIADTSKFFSKTDSLPAILSFYYDEHNRTDLAYNNHYEIPLERVWLKRSFIVLRIYNTDRKPYKRIYNSLKGLSYTFELDLPTGSINRVRKKPQ